MNDSEHRELIVQTVELWNVLSQSLAECDSWMELRENVSAFLYSFRDLANWNVVLLAPKTAINYKEYIISNAWQEKAKAAKSRANWKCQVCNESNDKVVLDAHHRTYERLGDELPEDITVLCRDCHSLYEANKNGRG